MEGYEERNRGVTKGVVMPWLYKYSKEFLDETIRVWQPLSKEPLTYADAEEITENVVGYFGTLRRWATERSKAEKV